MANPIEVSDQAVKDALAKLQAKVSNLKPVMDAIGNTVVNRIREGFETSTSPYGVAWEPLKVRVGGKPLVDKGHLRDSINAQADANGVTIGPNQTYAAIQQFGGTIKPTTKKALSFFVGNQRITVKSVTIPPRPYMPLNGLPDSWRDDLLATVDQYLAER